MLRTNIQWMPVIFFCVVVNYYASGADKKIESFYVSRSPRSPRIGSPRSPRNDGKQESPRQRKQLWKKRKKDNKSISSPVLLMKSVMPEPAPLKVTRVPENVFRKKTILRQRSNSASKLNEKKAKETIFNEKEISWEGYWREEELRERKKDEVSLAKDYVYFFEFFNGPLMLLKMFNEGIQEGKLTIKYSSSKKNKQFKNAMKALVGNMSDIYTKFVDQMANVMEVTPHLISPISISVENIEYKIKNDLQFRMRAENISSIVQGIKKQKEKK
ncbi:MAG TPA: hypothetical protein VEK38_02685 [Candidatus Bathyarchaeia archaeon]|nr:hypothetical protein [Candidatus Bathyarchaeia archaeon]